MNNVTEFLPFLVPLVISELALLAYTLYHILTHKSYMQIAIQNGHLCHVRRSVCDIIGGQPKTN